LRPGSPLDVELVRDELGTTVIFVRSELDRVAVPRLAGSIQEVLNVGDSGRTVVLNLAAAHLRDTGVRRHPRSPRLRARREGAQAGRRNDCMRICVSRACTPRLFLDR
jgi:hypothetical protein